MTVWATEAGIRSCRFRLDLYFKRTRRVGSGHSIYSGCSTAGVRIRMGVEGSLEATASSSVSCGGVVCEVMPSSRWVWEVLGEMAGRDGRRVGEV